VAVVNGYVTRDEVKTWLSLDPDDLDELDELIEAAINATSRYFDKRCRRHFYQRTEARRFEATDAYTLDLGHYNDLVSVTTLKTDEDGDGTFEVTWDPTERELKPTRVNAAPEAKPYRSVHAIGRRFPYAMAVGERTERIEISGTWGWPEVPVDIHQAAKIQVARIVKRREAPEGIVGLNQFGVMYVSGKADPDVRGLIGPYRLRAVG
jgi:hypothetical protein